MKILAITGGKGGTGKSTIATAMASHLARKKKVLLADMDVGCPNDHLILGMPLKRKLNVKQRIPKFDLKRCDNCGMCADVCKTNAIVVIKDVKLIFMEQQCNGCGACKIKCPRDAIRWTKKIVGYVNFASSKKLDLISGELKINEPSSERIIATMNDYIEKIKKDYDYVVIDTAAGTSCEVISSLKLAEKAFAVTEPTPLGEHDLAIILELLKKLKISSGIVLNRSDVGKNKLIDEISRKNGVGIVSRIPYSKSIMEAYSRGETISDKEILGLAEAIK